MDKINQTISKKHLLAIVFLIYVLSFAYIVTSHIYDPPSYSPDGTVNYLFSTLYAENGTLFYNDDLNIFGENIIRPNGVVLVNENFTSMKFIGFPFYYGSYATIIGTSFIPYFTLIFSIIGISFIYFLGKQLYGRTNAIMSSFLFLILPYHLYWSFRPLMENIFGSVIFVLGVACFFKSIRENEMKYLMLGALFLATSFNVRPDVLLFFIPLGFILIINLKKIGVRVIMTFLLIGLITITPILLLNYDLYGGYLSTGQNCGQSAMYAIATNQGPSAQTLFDMALINLTGLSNSTPLFAFIIIMGGIFSIFQKGSNLQSNHAYIFFIIIALIIFTRFYLTGADPWQGGGLRESYTRYILPVYFISIPLLSKSIQSFQHLRNKSNHSVNFGNKLVVILVAVFLVINIPFVFSILDNEWNRRNNFVQITNTVSENTEPNAIIFISSFDIYVYPKRKVATIMNIQDENKEKAVVDIMINLSDQNVPLYIYRQNWYGNVKRPFSFDFEKFMHELDTNGKFELVSIEKNDMGRLYKIVMSKR